VFEKLDNPQELFTYKLGSALTMEQTVLDMLGDLEEKAKSERLKQQLHHHAQETQQQIRNIEQAFSVLGEEPEDEPCPAIKGIEKEAKASIKKTDDELVDAVILSGAAETEHHEIAVYETLIMQAEAMNRPNIVTLLRENLQQEEHTLEEVKQASRQVAMQAAGQAA
jgi:ferritin-like metal-binding protein YciE